MRCFVTDQDNYKENPIETVNTTLFTLCIKEVEKDLFLCLILSHDNLYQDSLLNSEGLTISSFESTTSIFREEDTHVFKDVLKLYYDLFCLFHHSLSVIVQKDKALLKAIMNDYTLQFDKYFFLNECGRTYFNNCSYRGFCILPLDSKLHLYVQKHVSKIKFELPMIEHMVVFYKEYLMHSDFPQEEVEVLYSYIIGSSSDRREGYIPNWMDYGASGTSIKVPRKHPKNDEEDQEEKPSISSYSDLDHSKVKFEECFDSMQDFSDFCKINKQGFRETAEKKEGFILGPSIYRISNRDDPLEMNTYEIYAPKIFIRGTVFDHQKKKTPYKIIVARFKTITFVYLLKDEKLEEFDYIKLYDNSIQISDKLNKKVEPVMSFYYDNYMFHDSKVLFYYFNQTNFAIKYSPTITREILDTEMRHMLNVVKDKLYESNPELKEYIITASKHWIIGLKSLERMVVILLPLSLSQTKMEVEKNKIVEKYFSQFIF